MKSMPTSNMILRLRYDFRRYGVKDSVGKILAFARRKVYLDDTRVWYELPLGTDRPRVRKPSGLQLVRATIEDLPLLDQLPTIDPYEARRRIEAGHDLWLVLKGRQAVFSCWVFCGSVPVIAARQGRIALPPEIVGFEDSVASQAYRGRGIGLAVWPRIADHLRQTTAGTIITQVEQNNLAARRAFEKVGFSEIATVHIRRRGPWRTLSIRAGSSDTASWLAEQIAR